MKLDWKDSLLFALGFVVAIAALVAFSEVSGVAVSGRILGGGVLAFALAPSALRRAIFGAPPDVVVRTGPLWSLASMAGLLCALFGVATLALGAMSLVPRDEDPYTAELRASNPNLDRQMKEDEADERTSSLLVVGAGLTLLASGAFLSWLRTRPQA